MIVLLCTDEDGGLLFNGRRPSRDRAVTADILAMAAGKRLWMDQYARKLFPPEADITVAADFLALAGPGELCFAEGTPLAPVEGRIEEIVRYRWSKKRYPADVRLDVALPGPVWTLREAWALPGHSHEVIAKERYTR